MHSVTYRIIATAYSSCASYTSIYHGEYEVLWCNFCSRYRSLRVMVSKSPRDEHTHPSSHTLHAYLTTAKKNQCLHFKGRKSKLFLSKLLSQQVHVMLNNDIRVMVSESSDVVGKTYPKDSFQHLFWEQQKKSCIL